MCKSCDTEVAQVLQAMGERRLRECPQCNGKGIWYGCGEVTGKCYACSGTGQQDRKDVRRNTYYWNHHARLSLA